MNARTALLALPLAALLALPVTARAQAIPSYDDPIQFPVPAATHFLQGYVEKTTTVVVQGRNPGRTWTLSLRSKDPNLGSYGKPLAHVLWQLDGTSTWTPLTTSFVNVLSDRGSINVVVHFRILLFWDLDLPENYETALAWRLVD